MKTMRLPLLLLMLVSTLTVHGQAALPAQYSREYADLSTALQQTLLANYNTNVPPKTTERTGECCCVRGRH